MFEAKLGQTVVLKKILDAIKDLVTEANFECSHSGISLQAMDSSHVSLVHMLLRTEGFEEYRCDRPSVLGINLLAMSKVIKCAGNTDSCTLRSTEQSDSLTMVFESPKGDRVSDFELKLLEIESERMGIPKTEYQAVVKMPSAEFQRICRDLTILTSDVVLISCTKGGIRFSVKGEIGSGNIQCHPTTDADVPPEEVITIDLKEPVTLKFALRYLNFFAKATALSGSVTLSLSDGVPLSVEYHMGDLGYCRFYLAPKIEDEGDD